jgi:hypothetical protein
MRPRIPQAWAGIIDLFQPKYKTIMVEDLPPRLDRNTLYIAGEGKYRWYVAMMCPCGCGDTIQLNVRNDAHPYWRIIEQKGTVSLEPSIHRLKGCRSHFFLRKGRIRWAR